MTEKDKMTETIIEAANKLRDMNTPKPLIPTDHATRRQRATRKEVSHSFEFIYPENPAMHTLDNLALGSIIAGFIVSGMALGMALK